MRPLFVVNFEHVEASPFVVALLYDEEGELIDGMTMPGADVSTALMTVKLMTESHSILAPEIWTSDRALYMEILTRPGVLGVIKHPSDTRQTRRHIEQDAEILHDLYDIQPLNPRQKAPRWRTFLVSALIALKNYVKGDYEI